MPIDWLKLPKMDSLKGLQLVQLIRYGSMFGIGVVLVKAGFQKETIGNFESLTFITAAVSFFWITGIIQSLLSLYKSDSGKDSSLSQTKTPELFNTFFLLLLFSFLAAVLVIIIGAWLTDFLDADLGPNLIYYLAVYVFLQGPASLTEYIYLLKKETRRMIHFGWISYGIQFLAIASTAMAGVNIEWVLVALIASVLLRFIWLLYVLRRYSEFKISWPYMREHMSVGAPIIISVLLSGSAQYVDGAIIKSQFDQGVFTMFRYGAKELPLVALLAHALSSAMVPEISRLGPVQGLKLLKKRSSNLGSWLFPTSLVFVLFSYLLFALLYDNQYIESAAIFNVYILLIVTRLLFPQTLLIAFRKTSFLMQASALELIMNIGLSFYFVQIWGVIGVAYATIVAYMFERVLLIAYVRIILGLRLRDYLNIINHVIWSLILIAAFIFVELFFGDFLINQIL